MVSTEFPQRCRLWKPRKPLKKEIVISQKAPISGRGLGVTLAETASGSSDRSRAPQDARRKEKYGSQEGQNTFHGDAKNAKRQQDEPNKRISNQGEQRERPAEEEQNAPQKESGHGNPLTSYYARAQLEVPSFAKALSLSLRAIDTGTSASISM